jgi:hypothetical protein
MATRGAADVDWARRFIPIHGKHPPETIMS